MIDVATSYLRSGLCVLPAILAEKRPALSGWKQYQRRLPTERQVTAWFADGPPVCMLAGAVSGNLEMIDFDHGGELFEPWRQLVAGEAPGLLDRLVFERSQSGGRHAIYRCEAAVLGNRKLAQRMIVVSNAEPVVIHGKRYVPRLVAGRYEITLTLIETRGDGGLFLCAPTPGYCIEQGTFDQLPVLTEAEQAILIEAACALNEAMPPIERRRALPAGSGRPGDEFNDRGDVGAILERNDWQMVRGGENEYWRRPGKEQGWSATLRGGVFYVFSSNAAPFEPDKAYAPFTVDVLKGNQSSAFASILPSAMPVAIDSTIANRQVQFVTPTTTTGARGDQIKITVGVSGTTGAQG
ncbi:MAG: bifunctional DNA primase/polymerase, partial [Pirellulales bacterium]